MTSLMRTLSLGLVIVAVTLQAVAANTATYPLSEQSGGHESDLSDDDIILVDPEYGSGPECVSGSGALKFNHSDTVWPTLFDTDGSLTFSDTMSFFIHVYHEHSASVIEYYNDPLGTQGLFVIMETNYFYVVTPPTTVTTMDLVTLPTFTWHHIGFTFDSGVMRLYANGNNITQQTVGAISTNFNAIRFGFQFHGKMACAYFSSDVLDDGSIRRLVEEGCQYNIWPVCPDDQKCNCEDRPCDQIAGYGYCDPSKCKFSNNVESGTAFYKNCPSNQCCCQMVVVQPEPAP